MKSLFSSLIWPAVAGNVAWSLGNMLIRNSWEDPEFQSRFLAVAILALYLAADYVRMLALENTKKKLGKAFWPFDLAHSGAVIAFVIGAEANADWIDLALVGLLWIGVVGHLAGSWERTDGKVRQGVKWKRRAILAGVNGMGLVALHFAAQKQELEGPGWHVAISIGVVVLVWFLVRNRWHEFLEDNQPS